MPQPSHYSWSVRGAVLASFIAMINIAAAWTWTQPEIFPHSNNNDNNDNNDNDNNDNNAQQVLTSPERSSTSRPNIVFVLTDDQDLHMNSLDYLPLIHKHLIGRGTLYKKHFCTTAICCPARVSILTGKLSHNTNVTDVAPPYGGYPKFISRGYNENYLPVWLQDAGYNTYYTGKLFNAHHVNNYDSPFVAGWNGSDFLLDPYTYMYLNATYQRNHDTPVNHTGEHSVDILAAKALGFLDEAASHKKPFFLGIAPVAPHSNVNGAVLDLPPDTPLKRPPEGSVGPPIPAERHKDLFPDARIPRLANFNPEQPSGANWIRQLPRLDQESIDYHDHFYRQRLRVLQSVDELVEGVVTRLEEYGILDNTYIIYTTDNGYHLSQHRLRPGKECGFDEDINIPLVIRGPGVPEGLVTEVVTTHIDLAPTILQLAGAPLRADFDGLSVPLSAPAIAEASKTRHEHVTVEFWGLALSEGGTKDDYFLRNNTYKAVRIVGHKYSLYYSVWCTNEHELYDLTTDPGQVKNLLHPDENVASHLLGFPIKQVTARLDSLLFVLKSCTGATCTHPWRALHPSGNVKTLRDALSPRFNHFYLHQQKKVSYSSCESGYIVDAEGPQFQLDGSVYRDGLKWSEWV